MCRWSRSRIWPVLQLIIVARLAREALRPWCIAHELRVHCSNDAVHERTQPDARGTGLGPARRADLCLTSSRCHECERDRVHGSRGMFRVWTGRRDIRGPRHIYHRNADWPGTAACRALCPGGFQGCTDASVTVEEPSKWVGNTYKFSGGETYLVFAYRPPGSNALTTGGECSYTQRLAVAEKALAYARRIASLRPGTGGRVDGSVQLHHWPGLNFPASATPLPGIRVLLEGDHGRYQTVTNWRGRFSIRGVTPGIYLARADVSPTYDGGRPIAVRVWDPVGCGRLNLPAAYDAHLSGRLMFPDGRPAVGLRVVAVPRRVALSERENLWKSAWTNEQGRFEVRGLAPENYELRVNTLPGDENGLVFYRGENPVTARRENAAVIKLGNGTRKSLSDIVLPFAPSLITMTAVVRNEDGLPVRDAEVALRAVGEFRTPADGRFTFAALKGRKYELSARHFAYDLLEFGGIFVGRLNFTAGATDAPLELVIKNQHP